MAIQIKKPIQALAGISIIRYRQLKAPRIGIAFILLTTALMHKTENMSVKMKNKTSLSPSEPI